MGNNKKTTIGYWYRLLYHFGLGQGPLDSFLAFRAGDRNAWTGEQTSSGRIRVNAPNLFGGEKSEGGLSGDVDIMMGEADQMPNDYLAAHLGPEQPSYRGKASVVWRGGRYGAMNPYPKPASFKVRRVLKGWDNDEPWYPEKAPIPLGDSWEYAYNQSGWKYKVEAPGSTADYSARDYNDSAWLEGVGGFGSGGPGAGLGVGTYIPTGTAGKGIWIRKTIRPVAGIEMKVHVYHDDGAWLWWNGHSIELETVEYFYAIATIPYDLVEEENVVALKVLDAVPSGSATNIYAGLSLEQSGTGLVAMNPAHILYDSLTHPEMMGEPVGLINDASFRAAADKLYAEGLGLCTEYNYDMEIPEFQQGICDIIGACLTQSRVDGQYYLDLIRGDLDLDSLPIISEDDVLEFSEVPTQITESVNTIFVEWFDPQNKEDRTTAPLQAAGAIRSAGRVISETKTFRDIPTEKLAIQVGTFVLQSAATPSSSFSLTTNRRPFALRPGLPFRLQMPSEGIADMVCIVGDYDSGTLTSGKLTLTAVQHVFSFPDTTYVQPEPGLGGETDTPPSVSPHQFALEAPYIELVANLSAADLAAFPDDGAAIMVAATRADAGRNYELWTAASGEDYAANGIGDWCPSALVVAAAARTDLSFTLTGGTDLDRVELGTWALWGTEIVRVDALDITAGTVTLGRGCADTVPVVHTAGSRIYFCGDWGVSDGREYVDGETVNAKLLTRTATDQLDLAEATAVTVTMDQRHFRPYPPAAVTINGADQPAPITGDLTIAWKWRDRVQQADKLFDQSVVSTGPEAGTTATVRVYRSGILLQETASLTTSPMTYTPPATGGHFRVEVETKRSGLTSMQMWATEFEYLGPPPPSFADEITADTPYLWHRLGETTGTALADSSGNGRSATISGTSGTSYALGQAGLVGDTNKAIKLLTDSGYIRTVNTYTFPLTNFAHVIAFQANSGAPAGVLTMLNQNPAPDTGSSARDRGFVLGTDGKLYYTFWDGAASRRLSTTAAINDGQRHLAHVIVGTTTTRLLLDGVVQQTINYVPGYSAAVYLYIGRTNITDQAAPISTNAGFRGVVDENVFFTHTLTNERALAHAQAAGLA